MSSAKSKPKLKKFKISLWVWISKCFNFKVAGEKRWAKIGVSESINFKLELDVACEFSKKQA